MIITTQFETTFKEYKRVTFKLLYRKRLVLVALLAGFCSLVLLFLQWVGVLIFFDDNMLWAPMLIICINVMIPLAWYNVSKKQFNNNKFFKAPVTYTFDDEKISWSREGNGGYIGWEYVLKYTIIENLLLLYVGPNSALYARLGDLTKEEITFIQSRITQTKK